LIRVNATIFMHKLSFGSSILLVLFVCQFGWADSTALCQDSQAPVEARVADLFGRLSPDEKLELLGGTGFTTQPIPRLGVLPIGASLRDLRLTAPFELRDEFTEKPPGAKMISVAQVRN
jgi:hypothetical protein